MSFTPLESISDLNNDWLTQMLTHSGSTPTTVTTYTLENDLDTSDGYLSNIYSVHVTTSNGSLTLVLKLLPEDEDIKEMTKELGVARRENEFYKFITKEELQVISSNYVLPVPKVYYSAYCEDAFTLVMENLVTKGYKLVATTDGVDKALTTAAFKSISKVHAFGYKYMDVNGPDSLSSFRISLSNLDDIMEEEIKRGLTRYCELVEDESLCSKLQKFHEEEGYKYLRVIDTCKSKDVLPHTLIHGDFWNGQTMGNADNDVQIIDWQFVNFSNPTDDLASYLLLSCGDDVLNNLEEVLSSYVSALNENLTSLKSPQRFTLEEVQKSIKISFGRGFWILLCSVDPFLLKNKISKERLLQVIHFVDSMQLLSVTN